MSRLNWPSPLQSQLQLLYQLSNGTYSTLDRYRLLHGIAPAAKYSRPKYLKKQQRQQIGKNLRSALNSSSPYAGSGGAWKLLCLARGETYLRNNKPICHFFEEHSCQKTCERTQGVEESEFQVVLREVVDGQVGNPDQARVEEGSEGVEDGGGQKVVQFVNPTADLMIEFVQPSYDSHAISTIETQIHTVDQSSAQRVHN